VPFVLVAHPSFPATNAKEFIAHLAREPGQVHLLVLARRIGAPDYGAVQLNGASQGFARALQGSAPALTDIVGGQIDYTIETVAATIGHIKGRPTENIRHLVCAAYRRHATSDDRGSGRPPGYDIGAWIGYTAPPGTSREIRVRLSDEIQKVMPELKERYVSLGLDAVSNTPDEMAAFMRDQQERYGSIIRSQNIKIEQ